MGMILEAAGIGFTYPGRSKPTFEGVSLAISEGEILCVLGPNGVGKSTLLRCLAGLSPADCGSVRLGGKAISSLTRPEIARQLALVPQSYETVFAFKVRTVVEMGRAPHLGLLEAPGKEAEELAHGAMQMLGIDHLAEVSYSEISGGERQLVQIARVLVQSPRLMILDEPTAHLDFANQARFLALIRRLAKGGLSVIFTTHAPDHADQLAHRTLILSANQPPLIGDTPDILSGSVLSTTYGIPIRTVQADGRMLFVADVDELNQHH